MIIAAQPDLPIYRHRVCIRFDDVSGRMPRIHHNSTHIAVGVTRLSVDDSGQLVVHLQRDAEGRTMPILSGWVHLDETLANGQWSAGFTSGVGQANIRFYRNGTRASCRNPALYSTYANIWCGWDTMARADLMQAGHLEATP
ncbi:hypothetical protein [Allonocardiopsis opalescens]|uniref:Uncharacterized protein n=1 Tax=Allonocardiopsis opalescens TaxID=1144618 RepID=A0A2T0Q953_9ACTN|nr:hypothetical protein [Allonocardiopsis opalescens]PRY00416.1 hypothetical protein CLV72_10245 [Allonocardiopsis opalescens]